MQTALVVMYRNITALQHGSRRGKMPSNEKAKILFTEDQNATKLIKHGQVRTHCNLSLFSPSCWRDIWKSSSMKLNIEDTPY